MTVVDTSPPAAASPESQASGSSFYAAMRLLPRREREAMFAIYAFCRKVDDIADEPGPSRAERTLALEVWRADIDSLYAGETRPDTEDLATPIRRFNLSKDDFVAIIEGMRMDVDGDIRAPSFETLDLYCDRVASAVGRLGARVFGMEIGPGHDLAHHLGRALQFTNILRDLDEDAAMGRLYLPAEALRAAGILSDVPARVIANPAVDAASRWLARRAQEHYRAADRILAAARLGRLRAPRLMSAVYRQILARMEAAGWAAPRARVRLGKVRLAWIALTRGLLG
jgi:phytoene synthase